MAFKYPEYYTNDNIDKPIEQIWEDIDSYTNEVFIDDSLEKKIKHSIAHIILPPLKTKDNIIKGILASRSLDYIHTVFPNLKQYFYTIGNSMYGSFPKSNDADAYFMCYKNEKRASWFKSRYPERSNKLLLPCQDADLTNDRMYYPINIDKNIDVLVVSRLNKSKNLDVLLKSLIYIEQKYNIALKCTLITGSSDNHSNNDPLLNELYEIADGKDKFDKYITIVDYIPPENMFYWYSRAKVTALTSIYEGKNRCIQESLFCNTPVVCFSSFNKYIRAESRILPDGCAYYAENFSIESFGDTLIKAINEPLKNVRNKAMKEYNRTLTAEKIIKSIPYFNENIPNLNNSGILDNDFINNTISDTLGGSYEDFLYKYSPIMTTIIHENDNSALFLLT